MTYKMSYPGVINNCMEFCRINLLKTNYKEIDGYLFTLSEREQLINKFKEIYAKYCIYKKFKSVMPLFDSVITDSTNDVIGYKINNKLVAFSILKKYDEENVEALQFAWDYADPNLLLGIKSIHHECAYYKKNDFKYLYLGLVDRYKEKFDGYEVLGPYAL